MGTAIRLAVCVVMVGTSLALFNCGSAPPVNAGYFTPTNAPFSGFEKAYSSPDRAQEEKAKQEKAQGEKAKQEQATSMSSGVVPQK